MVQYGIFRVYVYFCNLVIFRVIINTLVCNHILVIVKSLTCRFHGCKHIAESRKIYVFSSFFFIPILSLHDLQQPPYQDTSKERN